MLKLCINLILILCISACSSIQKLGNPSSNVESSKSDQAALLVEAESHFNDGIVLMRDSTAEEKHEFWSEYTSRYPDVTGAWVNLALVQQQLDNYEDAEKSIAIADSINPDFCGANAIRFNNAQRDFDLERMGSILNNWIQCDAENPVVVMNLGIYWDKYQNAIDKALPYYQSYLSLVEDGETTEKISMWIADLERRSEKIIASEE